jgi:mannosyltransferase OCH1-like enzyme
MQYCPRRILLYSFLFLLILAIIILWPWIHAGYVWRRSTIQILEHSKSFSSNSIPRIIHQTYRDIHSIPYQWQQASNSCRTLHPDYEYKFWTDEEGRRLIEQTFPCLLSTFDSYPYNIQRADVIRLVVLYVYGGIYIDFDIICLKSLDQLLQYEFILPRTTPVGLSNDLIISKPKHPFLFKVINNLPQSNRNYLTK